jgi:hypothetical protein
MDECYEIIDGLLDGIEQLYLLAVSQRAFLTVHHKESWEPHVARAQADLAPHIAELFSPLRDALAAVPGGNYPIGDLRRMIHGLVDAANPPKADS